MRRGVVFTSFGVLLVSSALVATSTGAVVGTITFDQTYTVPGNTGQEFAVSVPDGVRKIDVVAVGANGGSIANIQGVTANGGRGAQVSGRISVTPGTSIWVEVGGNGTGDTFTTGQGGFNGGGDAPIGPTTPNYYNPAAGGGGASDVRTSSRSAGLSPDPRLIIAGGGGGAGKPRNGDASAAAGHGGAGWSGSGAAGASGTTPSGGGQGGGGGTSSAGGAGGSTGPTGGNNGTAGSLGQGGDGGYPPYNNPAGGGGGGGGGRYGGGGGRSGGDSSGSGGGGGGGSSLIPAGGAIQVAPVGSQPRVRLSYTIPNTGIASGPAAATNDTTPAFSFEASEAGSTFECRIDSVNEGDFAPCDASYTAPTQDEGQHTLDVRAVNAMGNFDATPVSSTFRVDTTPPVTTISGPATTTDATPTFTYSAEAGSTFRCAFDSATLAACSGSSVTAPTLAVGAHQLKVEATDAAGNVESSPAIKAFTVEAAPPGGGAETARCGGKTADIVGTDGKDSLRGTSKPETIAGLGGNDKISGGGGKDTICGGHGKDQLSGGGGKDRCLGGQGKDSRRSCESGKV